MPSVEVAEQPGTEHSEDVVRVLPNAVALLDGATTLHPTERTGGWYARQLADALASRLVAEIDLADALADSIAEVTEAHDLQPGDAPSSTVALLRWDENAVEALVLADSPIVMFTTSGVHPVTDDRLANLAAGGYRDRLRWGGGFGAGHIAELGASMERTRRWRNTEAGFWVAEAVPEAAHRAARARHPRSEVSAALLASDGVSCGVEQYGRYSDWSALLEQAASAGPQSVLDAVRAVEESDPDGRQWPRAKRHDDQTLAIVRF